MSQNRHSLTIPIQQFRFKSFDNVQEWIHLVNHLCQFLITATFMSRGYFIVLFTIILHLQYNYNEIFIFSSSFNQ
jgi:hypothetical protein